MCKAVLGRDRDQLFLKKNGLDNGNHGIRKLLKTKKTASFEAVFVPGAGVEPARFPTGV